MHFFLHNSVDPANLIFTRSLIDSIGAGADVTLECPEQYHYLVSDLNLHLVSWTGEEYRGTERTSSCPGEALFINTAFSLFKDIWNLYGFTQETLIHSFNRQIYLQGAQHEFLLQAPNTVRLISLPHVAAPVTMCAGSVLIETGELRETSRLLHDALRVLAGEFPALTFYTTTKVIDGANIQALDHLNLLQISECASRCTALITQGGPVYAAVQTETNRVKPHSVFGWDLPILLWSETASGSSRAFTEEDLRQFLSRLPRPAAVPEKRAARAISVQSNTTVLPVKKPRGLFLNQEKANCSIYESGVMVFEALKLSERYELEYYELSPATVPGVGMHYDFYVFNYHHATMAWLDTKSVSKLPGVKLTFVLEMLPNQPFALCPPDDFDGYCVLDPTMNVDNSKVYGFPRPLEDAGRLEPYQDTGIPIIGSFGFGTAGKGFELVVDAVNREFRRAVVRINIPPATFADNDTFKLHKMSYAQYLTDLCRKVAAPGIDVQVTYDFLSKQELINWCGENTLNCFLYHRDQPGLAATTDQAISSGRPLAVSANETFRHIHQYIRPYPFLSLREAIQTTAPAVKKMQEDWHPLNFGKRFESVLGDYGVLPKTDFPCPQITTRPARKKLLFVSHRAVTCGIHQYGLNISQAITSSIHYDMAYAECSSPEELQEHFERERPEAIVYNYYPYTMPWLTSDVLQRFPVPNVGIFHEVTQESADALTQEFFDFHICPDPTLDERNDFVFKIGRCLPLYNNLLPQPDVVTVGSFGFGIADKGFDRLITQVQQEFDQARIVLQMPFNDVIDKDGAYHAKKTAERCRAVPRKPGIELVINHEFLPKEELLKFLASNTINAFFYDVHKERGISSVLDFALAVQRPVAINKCKMFRHLFNVSPSICIEETSMARIVSQGIAPLVPCCSDWDRAAFVNRFEQIMQEILARFTKGGVKRTASHRTFVYFPAEINEEIEAELRAAREKEKEVKAKSAPPVETREIALNRVLDSSARQLYNPAVDELCRLCPEIMARKVRESMVQDGFVFDTVRKLLAFYPEPKILCVSSFDNASCAALKKLGHQIEEIDQRLSVDLDAFYNRPGTKKSSYHIIFAASVIEGVEDDELFMAEVGDLLAPGGTAVITCGYNERYRPGDRVPEGRFRLYTKADLTARLLSVVQNCALIDAPQWTCSEPDVNVSGCKYSYASIVLRKLYAELERGEEAR